MKSKSRKTLAVGLGALYAALAAALIVGNVYAFSYSSIISIYFNQETYKTVQTDPNEKVEDIYKSEYSSSRKLTREQAKYAETIQSEGSVLLINKNYALPQANVKNITLFGTTSVDFLYGGSGAGSISTLGTPTLKEAFENYEINVNPTVWNLYSSGDGKNYRRNAGSSYTVGEAPVSIFDDTTKATFNSYNDMAIIVIGRTGMEGGDLALTTTENANKHSLQLSDNEIDTIQLAKNSGFKKVVVLLNTLNAMELNELETLGVDACLWVGAGGQKGINAIPKMIKGDLTPSGRLIDTYARDALSSPAMKNFGDYTWTNSDLSSSLGNNKYVNYAEGIYVGYKYYETRYEDKVLNQGNAGDYSYTSEVQFPFGYGLTYTTFEYSNFRMSESNETFDFSVDVKNTGGVTSKEVVEIYMQSPYTTYDKNNGVEKSSVELVGFAKTDNLESNKSQTVKVSVNKSELASYDYKKAKTYIVDDGDYYFAVGKNSHNALNNILAKKGKTIADGMDENGDASLVAIHNQATFDSETYSVGEDGNKITNQLDFADLNKYDSSIKYLSRNDWANTFPTTYETSLSSRNHEAPSTIVEALAVPTVTVDDSKYTMPTFDTIDENVGELSLVSLNGLAYDSPYWDTLLNQMSKEDMYKLTRIGGYSTIALSSINKPGTIDKDGPAGISSTLVGGKGAFGYPVESVIASTYNKDIAKRVGELVGEDGIYTKTSGWYAPSMNIHRTQFSGRNFEYFSEDANLSGIMASEIVKGAQSKGLYTYIKHFAFNDQETNRGGVSTFLNEQAARENYLKPFETAVKEGGSLGLMEAMNRVGPKWVGHSSELNINILRNEWGFKGMVITDQASFYTAYIGDFRPTLTGGVDLMLCTKSDLWEIDGYQDSAMYMTYLRNASKHILYAVANSNAMNGQTASTKIVSVTPPWQIALIVADCVVGVGLCVGVFFSVKMWLKKDKKEE